MIDTDRTPVVQVDPVHTVRAFVALFIVMDLPGNIPIFLSLTKGMTLLEQKRAFNRAVVSAVIILLTFALFGEAILELFNISIGSFMIAGGALLLVISVDLLLGTSLVQKAEREDVAVVPMGTPLLAGPGAITMAIMFIRTYGRVETLCAIALCFLVSRVVLRYAAEIGRVLGKAGSNILSRLLALLVAAIAVQFIINGVTEVFGL